MSQTDTAPASLADGLRMEWDEFEDRCLASPDVPFAELVDGVVQIAAALSLDHAEPDGLLAYWLGRYWRRTPGVRYLPNPTLLLDDRNAPQADAAIRINRPTEGVRRSRRGRRYLAPPVELVAEISVTSLRRDAVAKRELYHRFGVREYVLWRVEDSAVDWLVRRDAGYEPLPADAAGVVRSETLPGLWLDVPALLRDGLQGIDDAVEAGCATPEHAAFVEHLRTEYGT